MAQQPVKIVIVLDGGIVQDVITAGIPVEYVVVDYDVSGADPSEETAIPQDDGRTAQAYITSGDAEPNGPWALAVHEIAGF